MGVAATIQEKMSEGMRSQAAQMKETQIQMAMKQRQAQMATQMAIKKEQFKYYSFFVGLVWTFCPIIAIKGHMPQMFFPMIVTGFAWTFQYDMLYGNLFLRAQKEAARMIKEEPERFFMPEGNGIIDQKKYYEVLNIPANYKPKLKP